MSSFPLAIPLPRSRQTAVVSIPLVVDQQPKSSSAPSPAIVSSSSFLQTSSDSISENIKSVIFPFRLQLVRSETFSWHVIINNPTSESTGNGFDESHFTPDLVQSSGFVVCHSTNASFFTFYINYRHCSRPISASSSTPTWSSFFYNLLVH